MQFIQGQNRKQLVLIPDCLDALIAIDNQVRVIDMFVDSLKLADYQFTIKQTKEGRLIERSEHAAFIEQYRLNIEANSKKRQ